MPKIFGTFAFKWRFFRNHLWNLIFLNEKYFYWIKLVLLFRLWPDWYIPAQTIHFKDHSFSIPKLKSHQIYLRITDLLHPSHFIKHHFYKSFTLKRPTSFIRISPSFANPPLLLDIHPLLTPQQLGTREYMEITKRVWNANLGKSAI